MVLDFANPSVFSQVNSMESTKGPVFPRTLSTSGQLVSTRDSHATVTSHEENSLAEDISRIYISMATPSTTIAHLSTCTALPSSLPCTPSKPPLSSSLPSSISASLPPPSPTINYKHLDIFYEGYRPEVIEAARISMRSSNGGGGHGTNTSEPYDFSSELFWRNSYSSNSGASYSCTNNSTDALYDAICYGAASTD